MRYSIAIAGCGVAGLTAGLALARSGHRVTLFEQSLTVGPVGAGVLLQPSGQLVLAELGLLERVISRAEPIERLSARTHRGHTLIDLPYRHRAFDRTAYGLHRGDLFAALHSAVFEAGADIVLAAPIHRFVEQADHVDLFDATGASRGTFDLLLAADGSRSRLREASKLPLIKYAYPHGALWAVGRSDVVRNKLLQASRGSKQLVGLLPLGEGRCSLFWSLECRQHDALLTAGIDAWKQDVLRLMPEAAEMLSQIESFEQMRFTTYMHVMMRRWHTSRTMLLGDAGHSMSPHLGQGVNLALLDGLTIAAALNATRSIQDALKLHSKLRRAHIRFYSMMTFALSPFFQSRGLLKGLARDIGLPILPKIPILHGQMVLTMSGMKRSLLGGALKLPRIVKSPSPEGSTARWPPSRQTSDVPKAPA
jgi:2-polyprenyl-6-methoxyphenol hydroxylase-like FAD-dependent oxidoreductase